MHHQDLRYVRHTSADLCGADPVGRESLSGIKSQMAAPSSHEDVCRARCDTMGDDCVAFRLRLSAAGEAADSTCLLFGSLSTAADSLDKREPCHVKSSAIVTHCPSQPAAAAPRALTSRARCPNSTKVPMSLVGSPSGPKSVPLFMRWEAFFGNVARLHFVQLGANCGLNTPACAIGGDPVYEYAAACGWRGVAVEPVLHTFLRLCENYASMPSIRPLRAAISGPSNQTRAIMRHSTGGPQMNRLIADTSDATALKAAQAKLHFEAVPLRRLSSIWEEALSLLPQRRVDLLVIDIEGHEGSVLRHPLPDPVPAAILFEHVHLGQAERERIHSSLTSQGYTRLDANISHAKRVKGERDPAPSDQLYFHHGPGVGV